MLIKEFILSIILYTCPLLHKHCPYIILILGCELPVNHNTICEFTVIASSTYKRIVTVESKDNNCYSTVIYLENLFLLQLKSKGRIMYSCTVVWSYRILKIHLSSYAFRFRSTLISSTISLSAVSFNLLSFNLKLTFYLCVHTSVYLSLFHIRISFEVNIILYRSFKLILARGKVCH